MDKIVLALQKGERVAITVGRVNKTKVLEVEANPQVRTINLYDSKNRKVTLAHLNGKKQEAGNVPALNQVETQKNERKKSLEI